MVLFFSLRIFQVPVLILGLSALWTGEFFSQKKIFFLKNSLSSFIKIQETKNYTHSS